MLKVVGASWLQTRISTYILAAVGLLGIGTIIIGEFGHIEQDGTYSATVSWNHKGGYRIDFWGQGNDLTAIPLNAARAYYRTRIFESGWSVIEIETSAKYPDAVQAYAAGFLEGSLTWQLIHHHWHNTVHSICENRETECQKLKQYLRDNAANIRERAQLLQSTDPFWHMVRLFYAQLDGLEAGWKFAVRRSRQSAEMAYEDFLWLAFTPDLSRFENLSNNSYSEISSKGMIFLKSLARDDAEPLLVIGHNTATSYSKMLRLLKRYTFGYHVLPISSSTASLVPGRSIMMSSYPGALSSHDEFYVIENENHKLISTGTPLSVKSDNLWKNLLHTDDQLMSSIRLMATNRLATNSRSWSRLMAYQNNGASADQWIVYEPRTRNLLLVEQLPGITRATDYTEQFKKAGFLFCTGIPNLPEIENILGTPTDSDIAKRNYLNDIQKNITTIEDFQRLMRGRSQEEFTLDENLIDLLQELAYRGDLESIPLPFGVIDSKVLAIDVNELTTFEAISGPAVNDIAGSFKWSETFPNISHIGHPNIFEFTSVSPLWVWV